MKAKEYIKNYQVSTRSVERRATQIRDGRKTFRIYMPDKSWFTDAISDLREDFVTQIITLNPKGCSYGQFNNLCEQLNGKARSIINAQPIGGADDNERKLVYKQHSGIFMRMLYNMVINPIRAMMFGVFEDYDVVKHNYKVYTDRRYADAFDHFKSRNYFESKEVAIKEFVKAGKVKVCQKDDNWDGVIPESMYFNGNEFMDFAVNDGNYFVINPYSALRFFGIGKTQYISFKNLKPLAETFNKLADYIINNNADLSDSQRIIVDATKELTKCILDEIGKEYFVNDFGDKPLRPIDIACDENAKIFSMTGKNKFFVLYMINVFNKKGKNGRPPRRLSKTFATIRYYSEDDLIVKDDSIVVSRGVEVNFKNKDSNKVDPENEVFNSFRFELKENTDYKISEFVIKHFDDVYDHNDAFKIEHVRDLTDEKADEDVDDIGDFEEPDENEDTL